MSNNTSKMDLASFIAGAILLMFGIGLLSEPDPKSFFYGFHQIELGNTKYLLCFAAFGLGAYFIWKGFVGKKVSSEVLHICAQCEHTAWPKEVEKLQCPQCGGQMEPLDGFYDRHPELKK